MTFSPIDAAKTAMALAALSLPIALCGSADARTPFKAHWAAAHDPVATRLIDLERQWAELACAPVATRAATSAKLYAAFMAPDFVGTSPEGPLYTRADLAAEPATKPAPEPEQDCKLLSAKVRYYTPDLAVIFGKESGIGKGADGKPSPRRLIWTDTVLKRAGKWQVIAVQDMTDPAP
ncbi:nuclear transport factor 2 family protein [Novosphingobium sp.]|uniref:nuclear transport factor 2 family protein n=1 Tax=Novosphingobium sp. TaxID=1874826 RepID=UPI00334083B3